MFNYFGMFYIHITYIDIREWFHSKLRKRYKLQLRIQLIRNQNYIGI